MPQTANSVHFYIRRGGYEPAFAIHTTADLADVREKIDNLIPRIRNMTSDLCILTKWEAQNPDGLVLTGETVNLVGLLAGPFSDFRDCTHFSWQSGGPEGRSGLYMHPRPSNAYVEGEASIAWGSLVNLFAAQVVADAWTDSEGSAITALRSARPSRRRRVRLAP